MNVLIIERWEVGLVNTVKVRKEGIGRRGQVSRITTLGWIGIRVLEKMSEYLGL